MGYSIAPAFFFRLSLNFTRSGAAFQRLRVLSTKPCYFLLQCLCYTGLCLKSHPHSSGNSCLSKSQFSLFLSGACFWATSVGFLLSWVWPTEGISRRMEGGREVNEIGCNSQVFIKTALFNNPNISVAFHFYFLLWGWGLAEVQLIWLSRCPGFKFGLCLLCVLFGY